MTQAGTPAPPGRSSPAPPRRRLARLFAALRSTFGNAPPAATLQGEKTSNALSEERTGLSTDRTLMAADRSLMAWIRTSLSMISFGFTIYKLLQGFAASGTHLDHVGSPRVMGLFLTGLGTLAMIFGTIEYWVRLQDLRRHRPFGLWRPSLIISLLMSLIGLFMFVAIIFQVL